MWDNSVYLLGLAFAGVGLAPGFFLSESESSTIRKHLFRSPWLFESSNQCVKILICIEKLIKPYLLSRNKSNASLMMFRKDLFVIEK